MIFAISIENLTDSLAAKSSEIINIIADGIMSIALKAIPLIWYSEYKNEVTEPKIIALAKVNNGTNTTPSTDVPDAKISKSMSTEPIKEDTVIDIKVLPERLAIKSSRYSFEYSYIT